MGMLKKRRRIELTAPGDGSKAEALISAFSVGAENPVLRAVHAVLDEAIADKLTDVVDPNSFGAENAYRRGEASGLMELKAKLLELQEAALKRG